MKKLALFLLLASAAYAQNTRFDGIAWGPRGPIPNASLAVCSPQPANTTTTPCSPLANLCSSLTDAVCIQPNPTFTDSLGNYHFYAKTTQQPLTIQIYGPQVASPVVIPDQQAGAGGSGGGNSNVGVNGGSTLPTVNLNGTTPAAGGGFTNCIWQISGVNVSCEVAVSGSVPAGTPGGILYAINSSTNAWSPTLSLNSIPRGGGSGGSPTNSACKEDGFTFTCLDASGIVGQHLVDVSGSAVTDGVAIPVFGTLNYFALAGTQGSTCYVPTALGGPSFYQCAASDLTNGVTGTGQVVLQTNAFLLGTTTFNALSGSGAGSGFADFKVGSGCPAPSATHYYICNNSGTNIQASINGGTYMNIVQAGAAYIGVCGGTVGPANATNYFFYPAQNSTTTCTASALGTGVVEVPMPQACTAGNLTVTAATGGAVAGSGVVTLFATNALTTLTCTLGTGVACSDHTHTVAFAQDQTWSLRVKTGQATDTTAGVRASFQCQ